VLIIGIGTYDYLMDGDLENPDVADGMVQLPQAARSARAVADWFLEDFDNSDRPLASLAMVLSEEAPATYDHERATFKGGALPNGDIASVAAAVDAWLERASGLNGAQAIFYFVGHGLYAGSSLLLCRDYGQRINQRFEGAINLDSFLVGMASMAPDYQLFLIDACRTPDRIANLVTAQKGMYGRGLLTPRDLEERGGEEALQSVHFATSAYTRAWANVESVSLYSDALLRALSGGGAQARLGWRVGTGGLQEALHAYVDRLAAEARVLQVPDRLRSAQFTIANAASFDVPVYVSCDPDVVWGSPLRLEIEGSGFVKEHDHTPGSSPDAREWAIALPRQNDQFRVLFRGVGEYEDMAKEELVVPPEMPICLTLRRRTSS
jgi:hypothetical protein